MAGDATPEKRSFPQKTCFSIGFSLWVLQSGARDAQYRSKKGNQKMKLWKEMIKSKTASNEEKVSYRRYHSKSKRWVDGRKTAKRFRSRTGIGFARPRPAAYSPTCTAVNCVTHRSAYSADQSADQRNRFPARQFDKRRLSSDTAHCTVCTQHAATDLIAGAHKKAIQRWVVRSIQVF